MTPPRKRSRSSTSSGADTTTPTSSSKYVTMPHVPDDVQQRLEIVLKVLTEQLTVTEGAQALALSRNHFQTLKNLALHSLLTALRSKPAGRPRVDRTQTNADRELQRVTAANQELETQLIQAEEVIASLTEMLREQTLKAQTLARKARSRERKTSTKKAAKDDDAADRLRRARALQQRGLSLRQAARAVGVSSATLSRWLERDARKEPLLRRPGPGPRAVPNATLRRDVEQLVRVSLGSVGANTLRLAVGGVSRRQAAAIKADVRTAMERERKHDTARVVVATAGVVRGFDAMHVRTLEGPGYLLAAADAAVPYRTSIHHYEQYGSVDVCDALVLDFEQNGAPLILRWDRARQHRTSEVDDLLDHFGVLRLHGPPHHPRYYGQLERQNREHRAWLADANQLTLPELARRLATMKHCLNERIPRRSVGWEAPHARWTARPTITTRARDELRAAVADRRERILRRRDANLSIDAANRFAIEHELIKLGHLIIKPGGRC